MKNMVIAALAVCLVGALWNMVSYSRLTADMINISNRYKAVSAEWEWMAKDCLSNRVVVIINQQAERGKK